MNIDLRAIREQQKPVLSRLMQLYLYEFSELEGFDISPEGLFEYRHLDSYWNSAGRFPFLIYAETRIAGFVLVNSETCLWDGDARSIAEFFVLRRYRRQGVGRTAALLVFDMFPGKWEVREIPENEVGQVFWRKIISEYTGGNFQETVLDNEVWRGPVQAFYSVVYPGESEETR